MDHANAIATLAVERYLLGELDDDEVESFEAHYFDCALCADDVRDGMRLIEGGREASQQSAQQPLAPVVPMAEHRRKRLGWMQLVAAAILAVGIGLPQFLHKDAPSWTQPARLLTANRDIGKQTWKAGQPIVALLEIQSDPQFMRYDIEIRDAKGRHVRDLPPVSADDAKNTISFGTGELPAGAYTLSITGVRGDGNRSVTEMREFQIVP
jgi:hypothetical protein